MAKKEDHDVENGDESEANGKTDSVTIANAPQEMHDRFEQLLKKHRPNLVEHHLRYLLLTRSKAAKSKGRARPGKTRLASDMDNALLEFKKGPVQFIVEIGFDVYESLDSKGKDALLLHEIMHIGREETNERVNWKLLPHDVECFAEEVRLCGAWSPMLKEFAQEVKQGRLFE